MESIIVGTVVLLDLIAMVFFMVQYTKKETMKRAIGLAISLAILCVLCVISGILCKISELELQFLWNLCNLYALMGPLGWAICEIIRCKNK